MPRSVAEWIGKNDDTPIPARVKLRVFSKYNGQCVNCTRHIVGGIHPAFDHIVALVNGGRNCESNLQLLCNLCHGIKTKADVREKSILYNKKAKRMKLRARRYLIPGSKGSGIRRTMSGKVWRE